MCIFVLQDCSFFYLCCLSDCCIIFKVCQIPTLEIVSFSCWCFKCAICLVECYILCCYCASSICIECNRHTLSYTCCCNCNVSNYRLSIDFNACCLLVCRYCICIAWFCTTYDSYADRRWQVVSCYPSQCCCIF